MSSLYFVTTELTDQQLDRLDDGGVEYAEQTLHVKKRRFGRGDSKEGVLFDEANFQRALQVLGASVHGTSELPSTERTFAVTLRFDELPKPVVSVREWHGGAGPDPEAFRRIASEVLLPHLDVDVVLHCPGYHFVREPRRDAMLHLNIWSAPIEPADGMLQSLPTHLFDRKLRANSPAFQPTGQGLPVLDDNEVPAGELVGKNDAYHFFDAARTGRQPELDAWRRFCEALLELRNLDADERERLRTKRKRAEIEEDAAAYARFCERRIDGELNAAQSQFAEADQKVRKAQAAWAAAEKEAEHWRLVVRSLKAERSDKVAWLKEEYQRFAADPKFVRVKPIENGIEVFTRMLYCYDRKSDELREIGEMRFDILFDDEQPIRIFNVTQIREGYESAYPHPHISSGGLLCYGNSRKTFVQLRDERLLYAMAIKATEFVESVNVGFEHQAAAFHKWPLVAPQKRNQLREAGLLPPGA